MGNEVKKEPTTEDFANEVTALETIVGAFAEMNQDARMRLFAYVASRFNLYLPGC